MTYEETTPEHRTSPLDDDYSRIIGLSKDELNTVLVERKFYDFWIGSLFLDYQDYEQRKQDIIQEINDHVSLFGLTNETATNALLRCSTSRESPVSKNDLTNWLARGKTIGELFFEMTIMDLDIESEDEGYAVTNMAFQLDPGRELIFVGCGDFWTERTYKDILTGRLIMEPGVAEDERTAFVDGEVDFHLEFSGRIDSVKPS